MKTGENARDKLAKEYPDFLTRIVSSDESHTGYEIQLINRNSKDTRVDISDYRTGKINIGGNRYKRKVPVDYIHECSNKLLKDCNSNVMDSRDYEDIPGGVPCRVKNDDSGYCDSTLGSITAPFKDDTHGVGMITSGHITTPVCPNDTNIYTGALANTNVAGEIKAIVDKPNDGLDFTYFKTGTSSSSPNGYISDENQNDDKNLLIDGIITNDTLSMHIGEDEPYYSQGRNTGRTSQNVTGLSKNNNAVDTNNTLCGGDSGGILFYKTSNGLCFVAESIYENTDAIFSSLRSTTAETIEDYLNGEFIVE